MNSRLWWYIQFPFVVWLAYLFGLDWYLFPDIVMQMPYYSSGPVNLNYWWRQFKPNINPNKSACIRSMLHCTEHCSCNTSTPAELCKRAVVADDHMFRNQQLAHTGAYKSAFIPIEAHKCFWIISPMSVRFLAFSLRYVSQSTTPFIFFFGYFLLVGVQISWFDHTLQIQPRGEHQPSGRFSFLFFFKSLTSSPIHGRYIV